MILRRNNSEHAVDSRDHLIERLVLESVEERRRARRWGIFFKMLTVCYVLFITATLLWRGLGLGFGSGSDTESHTALVTLKGQISSDSDASSSVVISGLRQAFKAPGTRGVILHINSPGGSAVQSGEIYDEIIRLRKEYPDTPIYSVIGELCASGGYYAASATDSIYANRASLVGSIGVIMGGFGFVDTLKKLGVERRVITAGENKSMLDPFTPLDPKTTEHVKGMVSQIHDQFISAVKAGREGRISDDAKLFSGLIWTGEQAVTLGLVDGLSSVSAVARDVIKADAIVEYGPQKTLVEKLSEELGVSVHRWFRGLFTQATISPPG